MSRTSFVHCAGIMVLGILAAGLALNGLAGAHSGATGIVKERMDAMKAIAKATKGLSTQSWDNLEAARRATIANARALSVHGRDMVRLFPKGSVHGPSEAIGAIWDQPDEFARIAKALSDAADEIERTAPAAQTSQDISGPLSRVTETCKACHADFRKKK